MGQTDTVVCINDVCCHSSPTSVANNPSIKLYLDEAASQLAVYDLLLTTITITTMPPVQADHVDFIGMRLAGISIAMVLAYRLFHRLTPFIISVTLCRTVPCWVLD